MSGFSISGFDETPESSLKNLLEDAEIGAELLQ